MYFDINAYWYRATPNKLSRLLLPLASLFGLIIKIRRWFYQHVIKTPKLSCPVLVVGNITVGGTGKTPFVIWLAEMLLRQGYRPGIISKGVGGKKHAVPCLVSAEANPLLFGDEAILLAKKLALPVVVGINRVAAANYLLAHFNCNVIISDDGLQHYRLPRDIEIVLVDENRFFGNKYLLPAGPLREPISRLKKVDFIVLNTTAVPADLSPADSYLADPYFKMRYQATDLVSVLDHCKKLSFAKLFITKVHAVAGIGNPERFFVYLQKLGFKIIPHIFPDHFHYEPRHFHFKDDLPIIMTEKDAVKCKFFADHRFWFLPIQAMLDITFEKILLNKLAGLKSHENA
jgi:tetraacyldisaccharide 4'-kinase